MLTQAINNLYDNFPYEYSLKYSGKFKPYRANIKLRNNHLQLNLSKTWKPISKDIQIGLIQELLLKLLKNKLKPKTKKTINMDMYNIFLKKLHLGIPKTKSDPLLYNSFSKVNEEYFYGLIETPNLVWIDSINKLGSYEYGTDTISISKILKEDPEALNYVMYHEMLHKKHKFHNKNGRSFHHTKDFRNDEKAFKNSMLIEKRLGHIVRKNKRRKFFDFF